MHVSEDMKDGQCSLKGTTVIADVSRKALKPWTKIHRASAKGPWDLVMTVETKKCAM